MSRTAEDMLLREVRSLRDRLDHLERHSHPEPPARMTAPDSTAPVAIKLFSSGTLIPTGPGFHPMSYDTVIWDSGDFVYTLPDTTIGFAVPGLYEFIGQSLAADNNTFLSTAVLAASESGQSLGPVAPSPNSTVQPIPVFIIVDTADSVFVNVIHDASGDVNVTGFLTAVWHGPMSKPAPIVF